MNKLKLSLFFLVILFLVCSDLHGQETITPLFSNLRLSENQVKARGPGDTLTLPFMEDFSTSAHFPDHTKWLDKWVYINNTMPVKPPTLNVATFDGLTDSGYAYVPNQSLSYGIADYLTSRPIDLSGKTLADSIYFSFYYQPEGLGNDPQASGTVGGDSLALEFLRDSTWVRVWSKTGSVSHPFVQVILQLSDTQYFHNAFQFRFLNYATLSGSFDHWHVDYIYLDEGRHQGDTIFQDFAFTATPNSLLKNYHQMPWDQYKEKPAEEIKDSIIVTIRNNYNQITPVGYQYIVQDPGGGVIAQSTGLSGNINPNSEFTYANKVPALTPGLPISGSGSSRQFLITNIISPPADRLRSNDTIRTLQTFDHHYAYDDGSAEAGYYLNAVGAQLAYKFKLNKPQVLTAVAIHWNFSDFDMTQAPFRFTVWSDNNGEPGNIILQKDSVFYPRYDGVNGYQIYQLNNSAGTVSGTIHIGWIQINADHLNIGFDLNRNHQDKIMFNVNGTWNPSNTLEKGSLMMRPIFGTPDLPIAVEETQEQKEILLFPNPTNDHLYISSEIAVDTYRITDLSGRQITAGQLNGKTMVETREFSPGIYLITLTLSNGSVETKRFIRN